MFPDCFGLLFKSLGVPASRSCVKVVVIVVYVLLLAVIIVVAA